MDNICDMHKGVNVDGNQRVFDAMFFPIKDIKIKSDFIFRYADEIKLLRSDLYKIAKECITLPASPRTYRILKFFGIVHEMTEKMTRPIDSPNMIVNKISYSYRKPLFISFLNKFQDRTGTLNTYFRLIIPLVGRRLHNYLELNYFQKSLTLDDMRHNALATQFNEGLRLAKEKQFHSVFKDILPFLKFESEKSLIEPYSSFWNDSIYVLGSYGVGGFALRKDPLWVDLLLLIGEVSTLVIFDPSLYVLQSLIARCSILFSFIALFLNIKDMIEDMNVVYKGTVSFNEIPELLKKHDDGKIVI
ncbi:MAG: hypothetical protein ABI892_08490 [Flavobacterium sp.]